MSHDTYLRIALLMRYLFSAAGAFIAFWALFTALRDSRRATALKRRERKLGVVALLHVKRADGQGNEQRVPLRRSGCAGAGRLCDARIRWMGLDDQLFDYDFENRQMTLYPRHPGGISLDRGGADAITEAEIKLESGKKFYAGRAVMYFKLLAPAREFVSAGYRRVYRRGKKR